MLAGVLNTENRRFWSRWQDWRCFHQKQGAFLQWLPPDFGGGHTFIMIQCITKIILDRTSCLYWQKKKTSSMSYLLCCEKRFQILNAKLSWTAHSAVFVVSTKHKNNNNQHPNNQLQRACKRLEFFTDVKAFSPVLSVSLSINKNWKIHMLWVSDVKSLPMKGTKYFPLSHVLYVLTSNPGRTLGEVITPLRFIRNRPSSFVHTMCCIDFFVFLKFLSCFIHLLQWWVHFR